MELDTTHIPNIQDTNGYVSEYCYKICILKGACERDISALLWRWSSGPRLNIKTVLFTYGDFHVKDKTAIRTSYL